MCRFSQGLNVFLHLLRPGSVEVFLTLFSIIECVPHAKIFSSLYVENAFFKTSSVENVHFPGEALYLDAYSLNYSLRLLWVLCVTYTVQKNYYTHNRGWVVVPLYTWARNLLLSKADTMTTVAVEDHQWTNLMGV